MAPAEAGEHKQLEPACVAGECGDQDAGRQLGGATQSRGDAAGQADEGDMRRKVNRAQAARTLSRCIGRLLLIACAFAQIVRDWAQTLGRSPIRHVASNPKLETVQTQA